jgi:predicted DsbA family dithiol-disulfide isomerase
MAMKKDSLIIDYYTDILCVWAWIAQRRIEELDHQFGDQIELRYHYLNLFGDTATRMSEQWAARDGFNGFAQHVAHAAEPFADALVNKDIWTLVQPTTSANAHLLIKAVQLTHNEQSAIDFALTLRKAFFEQAMDISNLTLLDTLIDHSGFDSNTIHQHIDSGRAMAALMRDYQTSQQQNIKGSPSYVMDNGRQVLYGNVGYGILSANIQELLKHRGNAASWC